MTTRVISTGGYPVEVATPGDIPEAQGPADITSAQISDATATGKTLLTATDAAAARAAIGAGTSGLKIGSTATDAKPGNYKPAAAEISDASDIGRQILTAKDADAIRTILGLTS